MPDSMKWVGMDGFEMLKKGDDSNTTLGNKSSIKRALNLFNVNGSHSQVNTVQIDGCCIITHMCKNKNFQVSVESYDVWMCLCALMQTYTLRHF